MTDDRTEKNFEIFYSRYEEITRAVKILKRYQRGKATEEETQMQLLKEAPRTECRPVRHPGSPPWSF